MTKATALREAKWLARGLAEAALALAGMLTLASIPFVVFGWRFLP